MYGSPHHINNNGVLFLITGDHSQFSVPRMVGSYCPIIPIIKPLLHIEGYINSWEYDAIPFKRVNFCYRHHIGQVRFKKRAHKSLVGTGHAQRGRANQQSRNE